MRYFLIALILGLLDSVVGVITQLEEEWKGYLANISITQNINWNLFGGNHIRQ